MKIEIGRTIPDGKPVRLDLAKLVDSRMLITASSGGGKSWALRLLAELASPTVQTVILDPEGEFASLREKFDFLLVAKGGEIQPEVRAAGLLARKLAEIQVSAVIDLFDLHFEQRREFVRQFLESLVNMPRTLWHSMIVILDEAHKFCPEGKDTESSNAVIDLMSQGRKRGLCGILATQRLSKLNKDAAAEANNNLIGRTPLGNDQKRAADILGLEKSDWQRLRDLPDGGWFGFGPAFSDKGVVNFVTADIQTTHPKAGQRHKLTPPKASEAVKQIAAQLADLPQQAEAEIRSMDDARRRIKELEREARARPVVEKPVETVKRVEIPVVGIRQIQRLESAVAAMTVLHESLNGHCKKIEDSYAGVGLRAKEIQEALGKARREGEKSDAPKFKLSPNPDMARRQQITGNEDGYRHFIPPAVPILSAGDEPMTKGEIKVLTTILQFDEPISQSTLAVQTGYKATSRGEYVKKLKARGFVTVDAAKNISATDAGRAALPDVKPHPVSGARAREFWLDKLPAEAGEGKIFRILIGVFPEALTNEMIGERANYKATSTGEYLKKLRARKLIEQAGRGAVRASANLFDVEAVR